MYYYKVIALVLFVIASFLATNSMAQDADFDLLSEIIKTGNAKDLVKQFSDSDIPSNGNNIAWLCVLSPNPPVDSKTVLQMAQTVHEFANDFEVLKIIDEIMVSQTAIFINPKLKKDPIKSKLLKMFLLNLYGSVNAEHKVMILFNVPNSSIPEIESFLKENNLYADEPTINPGKTHTQFSIQVDTKQHQLPLAQIRFELALRNAVNIDTLPIDSSIPSINVLGF